MIKVSLNMKDALEVMTENQTLKNALLLPGNVLSQDEVKALDLFQEDVNQLVCCLICNLINDEN